ncbi:MAG: HAD family hydrolase [Eubacterium sp.]
MKKIIVFDLGGTLMEFGGMPLSWVDYYRQGFESIIKSFNLNISNEDIELSVKIMKSFNPRINYREIEYPAEIIFEKCLKHWNKNINVEDAIEIFFNGIQLKPIVYSDTIKALKQLKSRGYVISALTDIPSGMPDEYFRQQISELLTHIDFYVSSQSCGYRKPNSRGIELIAEKYSVSLHDLIFVGDEGKDKRLAERIGCSFLLIDRTGTNINADIHNMLELIAKL